MVQYKQAMGLRRHSGQIVKDMSLIVVGSLLFSVSMNCIIFFLQRPPCVWPVTVFFWP